MMKTTSEEPTEGLGPRVTTAEARAMLRRVIELNRDSDAPPVAFCLWGAAGIGKSSLVADVAAELGLDFALISPAQIEEMGDLHGIPFATEDARGQQITRNASPAFLPTPGPEPGVLLLDDYNRADQRIVAGCMDLVLSGRLLEWNLPAGWTVVCTANPQQDAYAVSPLDPAVLTRMCHATVTFDAASWVRWAARTGLDRRGIDFVIAYPEVISSSGPLTTPRSFARFLRLLRGIPDLQAESSTVYRLGLSCLDAPAVAAFLAFIEDDLPALLTAEEVLDTDDWSSVAERLRETSESGSRVDRLTVISSRIVRMLSAPSYRPCPRESERHRANLMLWFELDFIPLDVNVALHGELITTAGPAVRGYLRDPHLAGFLVGALG